MDRLPAELSGVRLHGDDFGPDQIASWYRDEEDAYAELYALDPNYEYEYDAVNTYHGYRHLPQGVRFSKVLGFGAGGGHELLPISERLGSVTIVDSSNKYLDQLAPGLSLDFVKADPSGNIALPDGVFDLVSCLGVLHHIPNVTHVVGEIGRVTRRGGFLVLREPIISMGDWSKPRRGLTPRERGIPIELLTRAVEDAGFQITAQSVCFFGGLTVLARKLHFEPFRRSPWVRIDAQLSRAFVRNYRYHATSRWRRFRPTSAFIVAVRR